MAIYQFGDIVLIKFPFTDNSGYKKRPALVIKDTNDGDIIVCRITSRSYTSIYDIELVNWTKIGLQLPSVVRTHKIAALEKNMVDKILGEIEPATKLQVVSLINKWLNH